MKSAMGCKCESLTWNTQAVGGLKPEQKARVVRLLAILLHRVISRELPERKAA